MLQNGRCHNPAAMNSNIGLSSDLLLERGSIPRGPILSLLHPVISASSACRAVFDQSRSFLDENFIKQSRCLESILNLQLMKSGLFKIVRRALRNFPPALQFVIYSSSFIHALNHISHQELTN